MKDIYFFLLGEMWTCCGGSKPGSCIVPGVQMGAVTSYMSAHPGVQCAASDLIHIYAYGSVDQYTAVVSC